MRSDMSHVIVERPRCRISKKNGSWYPRGSLKMKWYPDLELAPKREGYGGAYAEKYLNENLQPLVRFLRSRVGRPWNEVHSEMSQHVSCTSAVQKHVLDHVRQYVNQHPRIEGGVVLEHRWNGWVPLVSVGMRFSFYVCPKTGILRLAPIGKRKGRNKPPVDPHARTLPDGRHLRRIEGLWYEVQLAPEDAFVPGAIVHKRQLGTRALLAHGLRNE
jgi:hypothetical protein